MYRLVLLSATGGKSRQAFQEASSLESFRSGYCSCLRDEQRKITVPRHELDIPSRRIHDTVENEWHMYSIK